MTNIENVARFHWLGYGATYSAYRTTHSAITRQSSSQIKGILKSPSEQDVNDYEKMSLYSTSNLSSLGTSAHSKKDKKKVTFVEKSSEDDDSPSGVSNLQETNISSTYQPKLKLSQTLDESTKYNLKKLLGHYSATNWPSVRGKVTLVKSPAQSPSNTNGQCRHSAHLKCSWCFKKNSEDKTNKELLGDWPVTNDSNSAKNDTEHSEISPTYKNSNISVNDPNASGLRDAESPVKTSEQGFYQTPQAYRPWSKTLAYLPHRKSSFTFQNDNSNQSTQDSPASPPQQSFEVLSKLTVTTDGKIRPVKTDPAENIHLLHKIANYPRTESYVVHSFKLNQNKPSTKVVNKGITTELPKDLLFPKFTFTKQWTFPKSRENEDQTVSVTMVSNTSTTNV
ncbi:hypothetical protein BgiMline_002335 [Biomphalaria glabrata]|nr:hypothetical protein BgiMline_002206 [Biomphalaria glabrata]